MELEEAIDNVKFVISDLKASNYNKTFIQAIETVLQALENTQKNYELAIKQNITYKQNIHDLKYNSIPKKKIEDKKEENSKLFFETKDVRYANRFKVLQELLEGK